MTRAYCKDTVDLAKAGDREAATDILDNFCNAVEIDRMPEPEHLRYVAECFRAILNGDLPETALHIGNPRNRPKTSELTIRNIKLAVEVGILVANNVPEKKAKIDVAERMKVGFDTVEKAFTAHKSEDSFKRHIEAVIKHRLPVIPRRKK